MSLPTVTCPHCQALLRSNRPVPAGVNLRCPECQTTFLSRAPYVPPLPVHAPAPTLFGPPFVIAVTVAVVLGASIITAALIYARSPERPEPVAAPADRGDDASRSALDRERQDLEKQKGHLEAARLVAKGEAALAKGQFAEAEQAFESALKLAPDSADAVKGLVSAKSGLAVAKTAGEEQAKREGSVAKLLADGKKALAEKRHAAAVQALESARQLDPAHSDVLAALGDAKAALDADKAQKQALADFRQHMDDGQAAMKAERFADAVKAYMAAVRLMPDDLEAQQGQKQAETKVAALADRQKRQEAFDGLMERGRTAVKATRFTDAVASLEAAARLMPDDKEAARALRGAKQSLKQVKSANARLLAGAAEALQAGRLDEARRLADDAVKNWAEDAQAKKVQANADRLVENQRTTQEAYARWTQQAAVAMGAYRYADAVSAYNEALRLVPNDAVVLRELALARRALGREVMARREADRLIRRGSLELGRQAFDEAETTFRQALRQVPGDAQATVGLSKARYGRAMTEGTAALRQKKRLEAVRAFETALAERPGDQLAANGLRQARLLR